MLHQILKSLLIPVVFLTSYTTCFGQFKNSNEPKDGRMRGKIDSVVITYFNIKTGGVKEFNDKDTYLYNARGLLMELRVAVDSAESRGFRTIYSYDEKGNYSQVVDCNFNGTLSKKETYTFDLVKRLVEIKNVRNIKTTLLLDKYGNILENTNYQLDYPTPFSITRYKYDLKGLCTESFESWTGSSDTQQILFAYDTDDNLIKETVYNNGPLLSINTYSYTKFDEKHNWLVRNTYLNGKLFEVAERRITYYNNK